MKRIVYTVLAVAMIFGACIPFTACNGNGNGATDEEWVTSEGLLLELNEGGHGYTLMGIGDCTDTHLKIGEVGGIPITHIADGAFSDCESITRVTIGDGVLSVGHEAFLQCPSLGEVVIYEGVRVIGDDAFCNCENLRRISIPQSLTALGDCAFDGSSVIEVTERDGGLYLGNAENPCLVLCRVSDKSVSEFAVAEGCKFIYSYSFRYCPNLTRVDIPDGVVGIGKGAFQDCAMLTDIVIPESVTEIAEDAFSGCPTPG